MPIAALHHRVKHVAGIWRKMQSKDLAFDQIHDLVAFRAIVPTEADCHWVLGVLHRSFDPLLVRFKDYIAAPKSNGYQSLHTTLRCPRGVAFEVQIRSVAMHRQAEGGSAAHWQDKGDNAPPRLPSMSGPVSTAKPVIRSEELPERELGPSPDGTTLALSIRDAPQHEGGGAVTAQRTIVFLLVAWMAVVLANPAMAQTPPVKMASWVGDWVDDDPPQLLKGFGQKGGKGGLREEEMIRRRHLPARRVQIDHTTRIMTVHGTSPMARPRPHADLLEALVTANPVYLRNPSIGRVSGFVPPPPSQAHEMFIRIYFPEGRAASTLVPTSGIVIVRF